MALDTDITLLYSSFKEQDQSNIKLIKMDYANLLEALGIGDLPGLNDENSTLNNTLAAKQIEISRYKNSNLEEQEVVGRVFGHWNGIKDALLANQNMNVAKKQEIVTEKNIHKYHKTYHARNLRDGKCDAKIHPDRRGKYGKRTRAYG